MRSCSCFHILGNISSLDPNQCHNHGNGFLTEWLAECSCWAVEASWVVAEGFVVEESVVVEEVVASPFGVLQRQEMRVVDEEVVKAAEVAAIELVYGPEQPVEARMTSSERLQMTQSQKVKLHHPRLNQRHCEAFLPPQESHWQQLPTLRPRGCLSRQRQRQ